MSLDGPQIDEMRTKEHLATLPQIAAEADDIVQQQVPDQADLVVFKESEGLLCPNREFGELF